MSFAQRHEQAKDGVQLVSVVFNDDLDKVKHFFAHERRRLAGRHRRFRAHGARLLGRARARHVHHRSVRNRARPPATSGAEHRRARHIIGQLSQPACSARVRPGASGARRTSSAPAAGSAPPRAAPDREAQAQLRVDGDRARDRALRRDAERQPRATAEQRALSARAVDQVPGVPWAVRRGVRLGGVEGDPHRDRAPDRRRAVRRRDPRVLRADAGQRHPAAPAVERLGRPGVGPARSPASSLAADRHRLRFVALATMGVVT